MPQPTRSRTPEEQELASKREELATLEAEIANRELELATLQNQLRAFEAQYVAIIGARYATLDELEARIAEIQAHKKPRDQKLRTRAANARSKATDSSEDAQLLSQPNGNAPFRPSDELKALYREIARLVHPDLAADEQSRTHRNRFMARANAAYAARDVAALRAILDQWLSSPENVIGADIAAELVRAIRTIHQVRRRLEEIAKELRDLCSSELFNLFTRITEGEERGRDLLEEMAVELDGRIENARSRLHRLVAMAAGT